MTPYWERGFRCHGYQLDNVTRVGFVGLPPRVYTPKLDHGPLPYGWSIAPKGVEPNDYPEGHSGRCKTLSQAKRAVERAYQLHQAKTQ